MEIRSDLIRRLRTQRGWTQSQLAEVADLSLRTVQRVENQAVASNETVSALCAVFDTSRQELLRSTTGRSERVAQNRPAGVLVTAGLVIGGVLGSSLTLFAMRLLGM